MEEIHAYPLVGGDNVNPPHPATKFRFNASKVFLTYSQCVITPQECLNFFSSKWSLISYIIGQEHHKDGNTHLHAYFLFDSKLDLSASRCFDIAGIHPNIKVIKTITHFKNCKAYLAKEDPANADLRGEKASFFEKIQECRTLRDALSQSWVTPQMASGVQLMWMNRAVEQKATPELELFEWQKILAERFERPPEKRKIIWICDEIGDLGKSELAKYLKRKYPNKFIRVDSLNDRDTANLVMNAINGGWDGTGVMVDLTRAYKDREGIYSVLEKLKNGMMTNTKYMGAEVDIGNVPHVMVFANWMPCIYNTVSPDRWEIYKAQGEITTENGYKAYADRSKIELIRIKISLEMERESKLMREINNRPRWNIIG